MPPYFAPDNWYNSCYSFGDKLGEGGFGIVRRATHLLTGENVAVKIMNKAKLGKDLQHIYQEISTMKNLMHQNICRLYQVVETKRDIYIVVEYCEQGEMFDYIVAKRRLPEPEARHFFRQLVMAIAYTHRQGFAHRDLKPENLLLKGEKRQLKVIDFGLSSETKKQLETYCGSLCYAAPEIIMNRPWSMGVLLYILVTGSAPFNSEDQRKVSHNITHGCYKIPPTLSTDCQMLICSLLTVDPEKRMKMDEIMRNKWVMEGYEHLKATSIYQKDVIDSDIVREMAINQGRKPLELENELLKWNFDYNTATYLVLLARKENGQSILLPDYNNASYIFDLIKKSVVNSPTVHASLEKDMHMYCKIDNRHEAAQVLTRRDIEFTRSPMNIPRVARHDKENIRPMANKALDSNEVYATPKRPENKSAGFARRAGSLGRTGHAYYQERPTNGAMPQTPVIRFRQPETQQSPITLPKNALKPDQKTSSQRSATSETPPTSDRQSRSADRSTRRPRIVASLERGSQRVFELLTPRRLRRDNSKPRVCKNFVNVSITRFTAAEKLRDMLMQTLEGLGLTVSINGWKVYGNDTRRKICIELEIVKAEHLECLGVKRKRMMGDGFQYKTLCESILTSGIEVSEC
ncbi:Non-specific serine/threonine protein kinase [Aphelenchoides bicaudatus]|nr:Non-specific serine/threonine protein kinase [Aphelenchoides bicaudatus]